MDIVNIYAILRQLSNTLDFSKVIFYELILSIISSKAHNELLIWQHSLGLLNIIRGLVSKNVSARDVARKAKRIFPLMGRMMESQMRTPAIHIPPVHFHVLNRIYVRPYTLTELAEIMSVSAASLSRTITVLEEREWLVRKRSEEDRRVTQIEITQAGHDVLADIEQRSEDFLTETLEKLSDTELQKLIDGLDILIGTFSDHMSHLPSDTES